MLTPEDEERQLREHAIESLRDFDEHGRRVAEETIRRMRQDTEDTDPDSLVGKLSRKHLSDAEVEMRGFHDRLGLVLHQKLERRAGQQLPTIDELRQSPETPPPHTTRPPV